jgi:hypothetical protein
MAIVMVCNEPGGETGTGRVVSCSWLTKSFTRRASCDAMRTGGHLWKWHLLQGIGSSQRMTSYGNARKWEIKVLKNASKHAACPSTSSRTQKRILIYK